MSRFPYARLSLARLFVLMAECILPRDAYWPFERLMTVNDSLKLRIKEIKEGRSNG